MPENQHTFTLSPDVRKWYNGLGVQFFQKMNVHEEQTILDFGCRVGNYTIPVAEVVGEFGKVYALDVNQEALIELLSRANRFSIKNIVPIKTQGELKVDLPDGSIDTILFYDVIYSICKIEGIEPYLKLVREFKRILKCDGLLTVMYGHINSLNFTEKEAITKTEKYLRYAGMIESELMHWDSLQKGIVHLFKKHVKEQ